MQLQDLILYTIKNQGLKALIARSADFYGLGNKQWIQLIGNAMKVEPRVQPLPTWMWLVHPHHARIR
jgi:hypothetical protein